MRRPRKPARLGPHQYCLRLRVVTEPVIAPPPKPHLIHRGGRWCLYQNKWKSQFRDAACISGTTLTEVEQRLAKAHNNYRFGYRTRENQHAH